MEGGFPLDFQNYFAGIEPGGLVDKYEIKLLICYLLSTISEPLTDDQLNFIFQSEGLVNYFSYTVSLKELLESGHIVMIDLGDEKRYKVTALGLDSSRKLQSSLPRSLKDKVVEVALQLLTRLERKKNVDITLKRVNDGYLVECRILDVGSDLMKLSMYANNETQAEIMKLNFEKQIDLLYRTILAIGIGNKDAFSGLLNSFESSQK